MISSTELKFNVCGLTVNPRPFAADGTTYSEITETYRPPDSLYSDASLVTYTYTKVGNFPTLIIPDCGIPPIRTDNLLTILNAMINATNLQAVQSNRNFQNIAVNNRDLNTAFTLIAQSLPVANEGMVYGAVALPPLYTVDISDTYTTTNTPDIVPTQEMLPTTTRAVNESNYVNSNAGTLNTANNAVSQSSLVNRQPENNNLSRTVNIDADGDPTVPGSTNYAGPDQTSS